MKKITIKTIDRQYKNNGAHLQQCADFTLTHQIRKADNVPFDKGSDIPELAMSVKSSRFTLASTLIGESLEEKVADFFARVHSQEFLYVTAENDGYIMSRNEFQDFIFNFCAIQVSSSKNGGKKVVRCGRENKKMLEYLGARA